MKNTLMGVGTFFMAVALIMWMVHSWAFSLKKVITYSLIIISLIALGGFGWWMWNQHSNGTTDTRPRRAIAPTNTTALAVNTQSNVWDWTWETFNGEWIHGRQRNAVDETMAEMYPQTNGNIYFDVPYIEYHTPQRERVRLVKTGDKTWLGDRDQDYPEDHSRVRLDEIVPGEAYSGTITWTNGVMASCRLIRRK
jgi:hypothetical protein